MEIIIMEILQHPLLKAQQITHSRDLEESLRVVEITCNPAVAAVEILHQVGKVDREEIIWEVDKVEITMREVEMVEIIMREVDQEVALAQEVTTKVETTKVMEEHPELNNHQQLDLKLQEGKL